MGPPAGPGRPAHATGRTARSRPGRARGRRDRGTRAPGRRRAGSTNPSIRPRCRPQTRSGFDSASSRNGQRVNAIVAPCSSTTDSGSKPRAASSAVRASAHVPAPPRRCGGGRALLPSGLDRVGRGQLGRGGQPQQHPGQHGEGRRLEAERRGVGGERVAVLRAADRALGVGDDVEEPDLPHPLEVGAHGVRVQGEALGDLGGGERRRRAGQLEVDGVARVVAERLQQLEARRGGRRERGRSCHRGVYTGCGR